MPAKRFSKSKKPHALEAWTDKDSGSPLIPFDEAARARIDLAEFHDLPFGLGEHESRAEMNRNLAVLWQRLAGEEAKRRDCPKWLAALWLSVAASDPGGARAAGALADASVAFRMDMGPSHPEPASLATALSRWIPEPCAHAFVDGWSESGALEAVEPGLLALCVCDAIASGRSKLAARMLRAGFPVPAPRSCAWNQDPAFDTFFHRAAKTAGPWHRLLASTSAFGSRYSAPEPTFVQWLSSCLNTAADLGTPASESAFLADALARALADDPLEELETLCGMKPGRLERSCRLHAPGREALAAETALRLAAAGAAFAEGFHALPDAARALAEERVLDAAASASSGASAPRL